MTDILTAAANGLAHLTLNRPQALHALNTHMCANMIQALLAWRDDPEINAVLLDHAPGTRGFCAGGDIRMIAESGAKDGKEARLLYITQAGVAPPRFLVFSNRAQKDLDATYPRYLTRRLREAYGFEGTPIRVSIRKRKPSKSQ